MDNAKYLIRYLQEVLPDKKNYSVSCEYWSYSGREDQKIWIHLDGECESFDSFTDAIAWINTEEMDYVRQKKI